MRQVYIIPILLIFDLLFGFYFLLPKYTELQNLKKEIKEKEVEFRENQKYFSNLQKISSTLESYKDALSKINSALPEEPFLANLLSFFQTKASENGLILEAVNKTSFTKKKGEKLEKGVPEIRIRETYINLKLKGSVSSFRNFLQSIEKSARIIEVEDLSLKTNQKELPEFTLLVKVYSY